MLATSVGLCLGKHSRTRTRTCSRSPSRSPSRTHCLSQTLCWDLLAEDIGEIVREADHLFVAVDDEGGGDVDAHPRREPVRLCQL